ncbi:hypothetical protein BTH41_01913 [Bacillus mycoides]|nr:hypothetical protein BTH41_01913 [Bacillus mycoides]
MRDKNEMICAEKTTFESLFQKWLFVYIAFHFRIIFVWTYMSEKTI